MTVTWIFYTEIFHTVLVFIVRCWRNTLYIPWEYICRIVFLADTQVINTDDKLQSRVHVFYIMYNREIIGISTAFAQPFDRKFNKKYV